MVWGKLTPKRRAGPEDEVKTVERGAVKPGKGSDRGPETRGCEVAEDTGGGGGGRHGRLVEERNLEGIALGGVGRPFRPLVGRLRESRCGS